MRLSAIAAVSLLVLAACTPRKSTDAPSGTAVAKQAQSGASPSAAPSAASEGSTSEEPSTPNPFEGVSLYVNPDYAAKVEATAKAHPAEAAAIRKVATYPTAVWLDSIASVANVSKTLADAAKQEAASGKPVLSVFVVYDLPNRDCSAKASAGELSVEKDGESRYKAEFIDKIAEAFAAHPNQRIVAILEPDSLPNLATNLNQPKCAASDQVYRKSIAYAISKLNAKNVSLYLDAAHAGWLGWEGNRQKIAKIFSDVLKQAGGPQLIRGFATNVSNYNTVDGGDGKKLGAANPCPDELTYVTKLTDALKAQGIHGKRFIIDTARNGKVARASWGSWCNVKGAGIGPRPQASPLPLIDAYVWVKPPGESDGTSDPKAARFDAGCQSPDSMPGAPEAGQWFDSHFVDMVRNAEPKL
ncbi:MAG: glycoside hydrolase family 6 protein [Polyangiaceae bacterium]